MSEYMFGTSRVKPSRKDAKAMAKVAKKHRCSFIEVVLPGTGYQRWFSGPNRGHPFDQTLSQGVYKDLETLGITDP